MTKQILHFIIKAIVAILILYTAFLPVVEFSSIRGSDGFMMLVERWSVVAGPLIIVAFILQGIHVAKPSW